MNGKQIATRKQILMLELVREVVAVDENGHKILFPKGTVTVIGSTSSNGSILPERIDVVTSSDTIRLKVTSFNITSRLEKIKKHKLGG